MGLARRRSALLACAILALLLASSTAVAAIAGHATFSVSPKTAGNPTRATLDLTSRSDANPRSIVLRLVRGAKFDVRAVAKRCTAQQANANNCPAASRIGGGTMNATVSTTDNSDPPFPDKVAVDLYLAPAPKAGDTAGIVANFTEQYTGQQRHVTGRVKFLQSGNFGYETRFANVDSVLQVPAPYQGHADNLHLSYGHHRTVTKTVNGKPTQVTYYLLRNPAKCNGSWPYQLRVGYPGPFVENDDGSAPCTS